MLTLFYFSYTVHGSTCKVASLRAPNSSRCPHLERSVLTTISLLKTAQQMTSNLDALISSDTQQCPSRRRGQLSPPQPVLIQDEDLTIFSKAKIGGTSLNENPAQQYTTW